MFSRKPQPTQLYTEIYIWITITQMNKILHRQLKACYIQNYAVLISKEPHGSVTLTYNSGVFQTCKPLHGPDSINDSGPSLQLTSGFV